MEISIGSYKVRLEILLLIVILIWIIFGHALCSCCTMTAREGMAMAGFTMAKAPKKAGFTMAKAPKKATASNKPTATAGREAFTSNGGTGAFSDTQFATTGSPDWYMPPDKWPEQSLVYTPGQKPSAGVKSIWARTKEQPPTHKGQLSFFDNILFKPECCALGSDSSSSMGCACYTVEDYNLLKTRGGNNVPFSDM